ncbi:D-lactate dehydrogenase [Kaistia algarum]|nr:D-lactate dehydrogenase [Kaistia algarum]PPE77854.1 D-lactate dehydrogenase [Kaistia algarum]
MDDPLVGRLRAIVGKSNVLTGDRRTGRYRKGYRYGEGPAFAVVRPGSLLEQWRVFVACVEADCIVIVQAANTGLNGGSTPSGQYDRRVVIINTMRIDRIDLLGGGEQVLCLAGATLHQLERKIRPLGREPHSVIGSTTIGASVVGGVCNNSGGALIRRGPAFTQLALFAGVDEDGRPHLVNHLGIALGVGAEEILTRLDRGAYEEADILRDGTALASDPDYGHLIRDIDAPSPARYNNDPRLLFEASGCAGKLCVFAVRLDTFPSSGPSRVFYIGSNDYAELTQIRRDILGGFDHLPVAGEYLHRDAYELAAEYGKDLFLLIKYAGTSRIPLAFSLKSRFDTLTSRLGLGDNLSDRLLQVLTRSLPEHLPARMNDFAGRFEHHLLLRVDGGGIEETQAYLAGVFPSGTGDYFECDEREAADAFRHRYAVGGGSVRYRAVHRDTVENIVALDLALPRNTLDWRENLPDGVKSAIVQKIPCGHFFCQVFHYDYAVRKGVDWLDIEHRIIAHAASRHIEFPSEHNVGHLYKAGPNLAGFYQSLDPTNTMNPGIGLTSRHKDWA